MGVKALPVRADLTIRDDVRRLYQTALEHFGRVDVLVNNAAYIGKGMFESFLDTPVDSWDKHLGVDLIATIISIQMTLPQMMERKSGAIINVTSAIAVGDDDPRPAGQGGVGSSIRPSKPRSIGSAWPWARRPALTTSRWSRWIQARS